MEKHNLYILKDIILTFCRWWLGVEWGSSFYYRHQKHQHVFFTFWDANWPSKTVTSWLPKAQATAAQKQFKLSTFTVINTQTLEDVVKCASTFFSTPNCRPMFFKNVFNSLELTMHSFVSGFLPLFSFQKKNLLKNHLHHSMWNIYSIDQFHILS